jgi:hypothetical protein
MGIVPEEGMAPATLPINALGFEDPLAPHRASIYSCCSANAF